MIANAMVAPQRFSRVFPRLTLLKMQLQSAASVTLSTNQGEANTAGDGVQITAAGTGTNNPPYDFWWKGELWYRSNVDNTPLVFLIIGEQDGGGRC